MKITRCRLPEKFASAWPELIIACDVKGAWRVAAPLQLVATAVSLGGLLQTDRQKDRHHNRGYILRLLPLQAANTTK